MVPVPDSLAPVLANFPLQAGPLLTSAKDITLAVGWQDVRVVPLTGAASDWVVLIGHKRPEDPLRAVIPLPMHTTSLHPSSLRVIFQALAELETASLPDPIPPFAPSMDELKEKLGQKPEGAEGQEGTEEKPEGTESEISGAGRVGGGELDKETVYLAIVTGDSTVVYYKLSKGIKKPADIPDE
ncbi:hypothetical protein IAT38_005379 [Cryptococcus sp. DSM 104549]